MGRMEDDPLFDVPAPARSGRVRRGVDADALAAAEAGNRPSAAALAALRVLAEAIDGADASLRSRGLLTKAYDRVPLAQLMQRFEEMHRYVFGQGPSVDPLERALDEFRAATGDHAGHAGPRV